MAALNLTPNNDVLHYLELLNLEMLPLVSRSDDMGLMID